MRTIIILLSCMFSLGLNAQTAVTQTFIVKGNCEECKERIENAADVKGVKICTWNPKTKVASVTFNPEKISIEQIQKAIAAKGHDAGEIAGNNSAYDKLPNCCKYRHGKCEEPKK